MSDGRFVLVAHGGAGRAPPLRDWPARAGSGMGDALRAGGEVLRAGGSALDAVVAAVRVLEANPAFNAGLGSVRNADGEVEMDASVMEGAGLRAGAVAGLRSIRHPVALARHVLDAGEHLFYAGEGAERLGRAAGLAQVDPAELAAAAPPPAAAGSQGTVGAVALDRAGHLAAATSTGGTPGKRPGRVGDSAVIGAGTYADDASGAVSTTGHGESFMRCVFAHSVAVRVAQGVELASACEALLARVEALGGEGGCVALDARGNVACPYDTPIMPRGILREGRAPEVAI